MEYIRKKMVLDISSMKNAEQYESHVKDIKLDFNKELSEKLAVIYGTFFISHAKETNIKLSEITLKDFYDMLENSIEIIEKDGKKFVFTPIENYMSVMRMYRVHIPKKIDYLIEMDF